MRAPQHALIMRLAAGLAHPRQMKRHSVRFLRIGQVAVDAALSSIHTSWLIG